MKDEITPADIEKFAEIHGKKKANFTLSQLSRKSKFYQAMQTDIGQELLRDVLVKCEKLLPKIIDRNATEEETIEYRIVSDIFSRWAGKIGDYQKLRNKVKGK